MKGEREAPSEKKEGKIAQMIAWPEQRRLWRGEPYRLVIGLAKGGCASQIPDVCEVCLGANLGELGLRQIISPFPSHPKWSNFRTLGGRMAVQRISSLGRLTAHQGSSASLVASLHWRSTIRNSP